MSFYLTSQYYLFYTILLRFLVSYWLNVLLFPYSNIGGRCFRCYLTAANVPLSTLQWLLGKLPSVYMIK